MFKNKQLICNLIALFILISGMCVDEIRADSVFVCPKTAVVTSLEESDTVLSEVELETTEILCTRNTAAGSQIAAQIINSRRVVKLSIVFLYVAIFSLLLSNFYTTERTMEFPQFSTRAVVLTYIHNIDGEK